MKLCKCGCGTPVKGTWVKGHNRRGLPSPNKPKYTEDHVVAALREFEREYGRAPTWTEWRDQHRSPTTTTIHSVVGSWGNALVLAGFATDGYESYRKWDENEAALARLEQGDSLTAIARDLGLTGQALGRRLRRHVLATGADPVPLRSRRGRRTGGLWAHERVSEAA